MNHLIMKQILFAFSLLWQFIGGFWLPFSSREIVSQLYASSQKHPISKYGYENYLRRLNSRNISEREEHMFGSRRYSSFSDDEEDDEYIQNLNHLLNNLSPNGTTNVTIGGVRIILTGGGDDSFEDVQPAFVSQRRPSSSSQKRDKKSDNFEVVEKSAVNFTDVGGYDNVKLELRQCVDLLKNYTKYQGYNIRIPRGLIFEGPPGNGKTLLAKALAGEAECSFIAVSGSEFQEKYVGVGPMKVRELFELARKNIPCIIFIDEIDALGRKRSGDGETSSSERDSTLNELLVKMDGFKNSTGIFVIGATNRADLLDSALLRPGRIDKRIYISNPDRKTREAILKIHIHGKPHDKTVVLDDLIEQTEGLSGAQIENLLNEAMLNALAENRAKFTAGDVELVMNKIISGWMPNEHGFNEDMIDHICVHELGHAVLGILCKSHQKMTKVVLNLQSPRSPGFTAFQPTMTSLRTREELFEHLMILLAGRIAEEIVYSLSVTSGAIQDFDSALKNANLMITQLGFGKHVIYPTNSEKYRQIADEETFELIESAYEYVYFILNNCKPLLIEGANLLKTQKVLKADTLIDLINTKYQSVLSLKYTKNKK
jgi:cell division protease FtsH